MYLRRRVRKSILCQVQPTVQKEFSGQSKNALKQAEKVTNGETIEEKADTTQLEEAIKTAEALVQEEYTEASWSVLAVRLQDAKKCSNSRTDFGETGDGRQSGGEPEPCSCTA